MSGTRRIFLIDLRFEVGGLACALDTKLLNNHSLGQRPLATEGTQEPITTKHSKKTLTHVFLCNNISAHRFGRIDGNFQGNHELNELNELNELI